MRERQANPAIMRDKIFKKRWMFSINLHILSIFLNTSFNNLPSIYCFFFLLALLIVILNSFFFFFWIVILFQLYTLHCVSKIFYLHFIFIRTICYIIMLIFAKMLQSIQYHSGYFITLPFTFLCLHKKVKFWCNSHWNYCVKLFLEYILSKWYFI